MKVVQCPFCGTGNVIDENSIFEARCIKCGNMVRIDQMIAKKLPGWVIWTGVAVLAAIAIGVILFIFHMGGVI